jgi:hypothetical protein
MAGLDQVVFGLYRAKMSRLIEKLTRKFPTFGYNEK